MKNVLILGSTGSIGTQALEIIKNNSDKFRAVGLSCKNRVDDLILQIKEFGPRVVCTGSEEDASKIFEFSKAEGLKLEVYHGDEGLAEIAKVDCDIVLNALMGISGLRPTYEAIKCGRDIALANKETLVAGGELITELCREKRVRLLPVDSEHSAIFQCLEGNDNSLRRILLTASGGPFRGWSYDDLKNVTVDQALKHPNWSMGSKITIDSATMMNKGLEVIEARWLFDVPVDKIDIHVHPESIVHSMVEFCDGSIIAQMGLPDMKIPISYALNYPDRLKLLDEFSGRDDERLNDGSLDLFTKGSPLTFEKPDRRVFKSIDLAYRAIKEGGSAPALMNGANEELVAMFLAGCIGFTDIPETIEKVLDRVPLTNPKTVDEILEVDKEARAMASTFLSAAY